VKYRIILIVCTFALVPQQISAETPWTIVSASDWHSSEGGVMSSNPQAFDRNQVLAAGRSDQDIKYIFVQAHTPCLPPVRAQSSSMMMVTDYSDSKLWQAMRNQAVDLFFAGEVHATTVSQDPASDLVQVVTDRHMPTLITVHDDKLVLQCFDRSSGLDGRPNTDAFHPEHVLTIRKTEGKTEFSGGKGVLKPLDTDALFLHYSFDKLESMS